jgi:2-phospho-L-lactate guanylyltransferase
MATTTALDDQVTAVLVPIKDFRQAKNRLSQRLDAEARETLARSMAQRVVKAAGDLSTYVVCNDRAVANWAQSMEAEVIWVRQDGLNPAVTEAATQVTDLYAHMIIAHADLPQAESLGGIARANTVSIVPDRHRQGTNVLSLPTGTAFEFQYGSGSLYRHMAEASRCKLDLKVLQIPQLQWDIDTPEDLDALQEKADPGHSP